MEDEFLESLKQPKALKDFIKEWNNSRLDMFALSAPNESLVFSGVMRFYFEDRGQKAVTKCIRVTSRQTVGEIMPLLIEKFCPDMKMLSTPNYELYEIHETGDVRKLDAPEKPLLVQLLWHNDDREGRFVLKSADLKIQPIKFFDLNPDEGQLKRRLSRREKKDLKKQRKAEIAKRNKDKNKLLAHHVYQEVPESSFTRTKSNPEAVMRRRRQQKLEKRMKEFQNKEGPQTGGILKIFAESLKPEIPYKTILASVKDNANVVTKAALEKFLLPKEDPGSYCIVMAIIPPGDPTAPGNVTKERVIRPNDCPLAIQNSWPRSKGVITFHLRRREPGTEQPKKSNERSKSTSAVPTKQQINKHDLPKQHSADFHDGNNVTNFDKDLLPYFIELTPEGKEINYKPKIYYIRPNETIIGSSKNPSPDVQYLQLFSPKILASHCSIVNADGVVSIVPHGSEADVRISGRRIYDNALLHTGKIVQFGGLHTFRFHNPLDAPADRNSIISDTPSVRSLPASVEYPPYKPPKSQSISSPPISPELKDLILNEPGSNVDEEIVETTFGVDGEIETNMKSKQQISAAISAENLLDFERTQMRSSLRHKKTNVSLPDLLSHQAEEEEENLLPAALTFLDHGKDAFFAAIINGVNGAAVNFKLAPTYTLYLAARHVLTSQYRPGLTEQDRARMLSSITKRIASSIQQTIQENDSLAGGLAFWMANASELLHFYRQDSDISPLTMNAQATLAQSIQESFALLVNAMEEELSLALPAFLEPTDSVDIHPRELDDILNDDLLERAESMELLNWTSDSDDRVIRVDENGRPLSGEQWLTPAARIRQHGMPIMADVLYILSSAMSLLRRCRVNAALTIQLFSQLFHFINMWIFNRIVLEPNMRLCSRLWGHRLRMRLSFVEAWAERQGLELAADCHLARIIQTAHLLEAAKDSVDDIADIATACFKLNSLQLRYLLENYLPDRDEPLIPQELVDSIVSVAESTSDKLTLVDGREVKLEEDVQLQLPFLLPEEGYSSDIIRGVPPGLQEFLEPLCETGLCELSLNPHSFGLWTLYQEPLDDDLGDRSRDSMIDDEPPIQRIIIDKGKSGLGLSICSAKGTQSDFSGIYIKSVLPGGVASKDGRIEAGDQILSVNESSLIDVTQTQAARIMGKSGPVITLEVMKHAAFHHGLHKLVEDEKGNHIKQKSTDSRDSYSHDRNPESQERSNKEYAGGAQKYNLDRNGYETNGPLHEVRNKRRDDDNYEEPTRFAYIRDDEQEQRIYKYEEQAFEDDHRTSLKYVDEKKSVGYNAQYETASVNQHAQPMVDGYGDPIVSENEDHEQSEYRESDYDSDGNFLTAEEKSRLARQRQRQIEYEERLAKWEAERIKQESIKQHEESVKQEQTEGWVENEVAERRHEETLEDVDRQQAELEARQEAERIRQETEKRRLEYEQRRREDETRKVEEEQRLHAERRFAAEERERKQQQKKLEAEERRLREEREEEERRTHEKEQKRREDDEIRFMEEKKAKERQRQEKERKEREKEEERRLLQEKEAEEKRRQEIERKRREEEERRLLQEREAEEKRRQEIERKRREEEGRRLLQEKEAEEKRRQEIERKRREEEGRRLLQEREAEEKRRQEIERKRHEEEERRLLQEKEAEEKRRQEIERKRREEEERRLLQEKEAEEKRRQEIERKRRESEDRQRQERERFRKEAEELQLLEEEEKKKRFLVEQQRRREEYEEREEERRRQENQRLLEERRKRDEQMRAEEEKRQKNAEERRWRETQQNRDQQQKEGERRRNEARGPMSLENTSSQLLQQEMDSIDDALREAEKIAAEMDLFMMEEEQKIEESVKRKHEKEKKEWREQALPRQDVNRYADRSLNDYPIETNIDDDDDVDILPPPPENLLPVEHDSSRIASNNRYVRNSSDLTAFILNLTNYNSAAPAHETSRHLTEHEKWVQSQQDRRVQRRLELERLKREYQRKRDEGVVMQATKAVELKIKQDNRQMAEYKGRGEEQDRKFHEDFEKSHKTAPPTVRPKNYKLNDFKPHVGLPGVLRDEFKTKSSQDYERRRQDVDSMPVVRHSLSSYHDSSGNEDNDAPPRPPPPRNVTTNQASPLNKKHFSYSSANGYKRSNSSSSGVSITVNTQSRLPQQASNQKSNVSAKQTPLPVVVRHGVGEPEVLDFKAKMKLFGK